MRACRPTRRMGIGHRTRNRALAAFVFLVLAACAPDRIHEATTLLADLAAGREPSTLKQTTPPPRRESLRLEIRGRALAGDLYRPGGGERAAAALVLVPGLAPAGKDDPRLVALARSLARVRFAVLVPDLPGLRAGRARAADARAIGDAVLGLARHIEGPAPPLTIGLAAISYAVGPALIAALDEDVARRLGFVLGIGGYYDLPAVIAFFTTGHFRATPSASWQTGVPNVYGKWVFLGNNADMVADPRDRAALDGMARRKLADPQALIDDLAAGLGAEGRAVLALVENRDPVRVPELIAALPPAARAEIAALDLKARALGKLQARVILVHGRDDAIIPWSESAKLAAALPTGRAELFLVDNLAHVDLAPGGWEDALTLARAVYRLLEERDRPDPGAD